MLWAVFVTLKNRMGLGRLQKGELYAQEVKNKRVENAVWEEDSWGWGSLERHLHAQHGGQPCCLEKFNTHDLMHMYGPSA